MGIIIRQSVKATIINYIGTIIGFITTIFVVTKFLKPEEIGLTKVIYEVAALVAGFAQLGTSASAMRFFPYFKDPNNNNNGFFFYLIVTPCIGFVIFISIFLLLRESITLFFTKNSDLFADYYVWVIPLIVFLLFGSVLDVYSNVMLRIVIPKFIREVGVRILLLVLYLLYAFHYLNLDGLVGGFVLIYGLAMLSSFFYVAHIGGTSLRHDFSFINKPLRIKILKYTLFLIAGALSGNIMGQLDIFMVSSQMGFSFAGIYTIALYMAAMIEMPARSITSISSPLAAAALKDGNFHAANLLYKKVALHQFLAASSIFLFIWINIDNIFAIIPNGSVYSEGKWVVFFIALSKLIAVSFAFGVTLISFSRYYYWGLFFTFFLTLLTIVTNYLLIPIWGMTGAALATLFTCIVSYFLQQWIVLKKVKGNPYSIGFLKQILLILFLFGLNELLPQIDFNLILNILYRSVIIGIIWLVLTYYLKISDEICNMMDGILFKLHVRK